MKEAVTKVIDTLTQENFDGAFQKLLETVQQVHLQPEEITLKGAWVSCVYCSPMARETWVQSQVESY